MCAWLLALPVLSLATIERLPAWRSSRTLWAATVASTPGSVRARYNMAAVLAEEHRYRAARRQLHRALRVQPDYGPARAALAWIACRQGRLSIARRHIEAAHELRAAFDLIAAAEAECRPQENRKEEPRR
jgi:Flp pilus assembly protein TadD